MFFIEAQATPEQAPDPRLPFCGRIMHLTIGDDDLLMVDGKTFALDGTFAPIYAAARAAGMVLTARTVGSYLKFAVSQMRIDDHHLMIPEHTRDVSMVDVEIDIEVEMEGEDFICETLFVFDETIRHGRFRVTPGGTIEMLAEQQIGIVIRSVNTLPI